MLALLGGLSVTVLAQEEAEWAAVTGTSACTLGTSGVETDGPPYSLTNQIMRCIDSSTDPRVSGPSTVVINVEALDKREGYNAVAWFDYTIEGPEGIWVGPHSTASMTTRVSFTSWASWRATRPMRG